MAQVPVPAKRVEHRPQRLRMLVLQVRVPVKPVHMLIRQAPAPVKRLAMQVVLQVKQVPHPVLRPGTQVIVGSSQM
ncbi:MAG: hypothetical protein E6Z08_12980 [Lacticaseibacillus rhamnosus]|nr:hypothetical protein [Lacticaseibacillus rhamnosus]